jgi:predicted kinase
MSSSDLNFDVLAEDNIRILNAPAVLFKKPLCIILVGIPSSGKTWLTRKLRDKFPLTVLAEEDMMAFLAPRATIFKRGAIEVFQLACKTIEHLIKKGKACVYDANIKTREQRMLLKSIVEESGGSYLLIYMDCPKETCYSRLQKRNLEVMRGETKGFILDRDFFEYEVASTRVPAADEYHLTYSSQGLEETSPIFSAVGSRLKESN